MERLFSCHRMGDLQTAPSVSLQMRMCRDPSLLIALTDFQRSFQIGIANFHIVIGQIDNAPPIVVTKRYPKKQPGVGWPVCTHPLTTVLLLSERRFRVQRRCEHGTKDVVITGSDTTAAL